MSDKDIEQTIDYLEKYSNILKTNYKHDNSLELLNHLKKSDYFYSDGYFKNIIITIENSDEFMEVQTKLNSLGCKWGSGNDFIEYDDYIQYIRVNGKEITCGNLINYLEAIECKRLTIDELIKIN